MFGYVTIYHKGLEKPELDRYQAYYCGLCRTLGRRYGRTGQLALSYDMAFVAILPKDARKGQFNALQELHDTLPPTEFEDRCHDLLTQQMGLCAQQFELLPILKETPEGKLLYNTIYSGVWSKYAPIRKHREGKQK